MAILYIVWFHSYEISRLGKSFATESRKQVAGAGRLGTDCLMGVRFPFSISGNVLELGWRWRWRLHNTVNILSDAELYICFKMVTFCYVNFTSVKKNTDAHVPSTEVQKWLVCGVELEFCFKKLPGWFQYLVRTENFCLRCSSWNCPFHVLPVLTSSLQHALPFHFSAHFGWAG